ncbi:MAG: class I SAM-dependent methyltransferase [Candidatus Eremiobacteraeota bacterium]|nr:class I SAM-dependent methyltransferase [Candidatus Eremiobacteraeota bacterium]
MQEQDIRPPEYIKECDRIHDHEVNGLLKNKKRFIEVPCPACESEAYTRAFAKKGFSFAQCNECETLFINPRPDYEMLLRYYTNSKTVRYWSKNIFSRTEGARRKYVIKPKAKRVIELCRKYSSGYDRLVDVGAGFGTFCEELMKYKLYKQITAIEPSEENAKVCRAKNIETIQKTFEEIDLSQIDVITNTTYAHE